MPEPVAVRIIKIFEGPRHERLYNIWEAIAEWNQREMVLRWYSNHQGLRHAPAFEAMWQEEREFDEDRVVFTEADWLPDLKHPDWLLQGVFDRKPTVGVAACMYAKRKPGTRQLVQFKDSPGGWFLSMDKRRLPAVMEFEGRVDPCTDLALFLNAQGIDVALTKGVDAYPMHVGVEYAHGTHLFWSRHLHDPRGTRVSGYAVTEIQRKHDEAVSQWIRHQPLGFQELLERRFGSSILGSCSESTDARSTLRQLGPRSGDLLTKTGPKSRSSSQWIGPPQT
jgi:hypothetical protein